MTTTPTAPHLLLILGGARSGKSALAERMVMRHEGPLLYFATAVSEIGDHDLDARIAAHQARRGDRFTTVEAGGDLAGALRRAADRPALVDALGTWLASPAITPTWAGDTVEAGTDEPVGHQPAGGQPRAALIAAVAELVDALQARTAPTVVVSDETGLGVHPPTAIGRQWRDALGICNQVVADVADEVVLVVAGRALRLSRPEELDL